MYRLTYIFLFIVVAVHEYYFPVISGWNYVFGFAMLKYFFVMAYLYFASFYEKGFSNSTNIIFKVLFSIVVSIGILSFIAFNDIEKYFNNIVLLIAALLFVFNFIYFRKKVLDEIFDAKPLDDIELKKAFLNYPPKRWSDYSIFYLIVVVIFFIPEFVEYIWSDIKVN